MKSILLVEDDQFIIDIYSNHFKREGFDVDIAVDGQMALDKIEQRHPDLLILDILLPKLDGWEVLKRIRENPTTKNLKVVVISNLNQRDSAQRAQELGVLKFFLKVETGPEEITNTIKEILT